MMAFVADKNILIQLIAGSSDISGASIGGGGGLLPKFLSFDF